MIIISLIHARKLIHSAIDSAVSFGCRLQPRTYIIKQHHPITKTTHIHYNYVAVLEYEVVLFDNSTAVLTERLENIQLQATLAITKAYKHTSYINLPGELQLETLIVINTLDSLIHGNSIRIIGELYILISMKDYKLKLII